MSGERLVGAARRALRAWDALPTDVAIDFPDLAEAFGEVRVHLAAFDAASPAARDERFAEIHERAIALANETVATYGIGPTSDRVLRALDQIIAVAAGRGGDG